MVLSTTLRRGLYWRVNQPGQPAQHATPDYAEEQHVPPSPTDFSAFFEQMTAQFQSWAGPRYQHIEDQYAHIEAHYQQ